MKPTNTTTPIKENWTAFDQPGIANQPKRIEAGIDIRACRSLTAELTHNTTDPTKAIAKAIATAARAA